VKGTIHWVSAEHAVAAEVRLYDHMFKTPDPEDVPEGADWRTNLNPNSLEVIKDARLEPSLKAAPPTSRYQFERLGYFAVDKDATSDLLVFNRTVTLKDTWAKEEKKQQPAAAKAGAGAGGGAGGKKK
jgi:glutaminyl-tRNA synthetase